MTIMSLQEKLEIIYNQRKEASQKPKPIIIKNVALAKGEFSKLNSKNIYVM